MIYQLGDLINGCKVIPANYGSISHLPGSKMIDDSDKLIGNNEINLLTVKRKQISDMVIVTEKIDGMNAGVIRLNDKLYPIVRKGYDCRSNPCKWIQSFADYVNDNITRFYDLLWNGERICGEWMIKTHTLEYNIKTEPFIPFDIISDHKREEYFEFVKRVRYQGFTPTGLVHCGTSISTDDAIKLLGNGFSGVKGQPEGVVYRYQNDKGETICMAKYVANPLLGNKEIFQANKEKFNTIKSQYRKYQIF